VVDPLDGTTNFLHGIPHFGISIAVMETDQQGRRSITAGSIFDPVKNEFFYAERGKGAYLNEAPLRVSDAGRWRIRCLPPASRSWAAAMMTSMRPF
jgi:myo-inositol-1(or 4)-monophosphatase